MDWLAAIRELAIAASTLVAAAVAVAGLNTWRAQLSGQNEYEVGLRVLKATFKVRDAIQIVRQPFMTPSEQAAAIAETGVDLESVDEDKRSGRAARAAYEVRWRGISEGMRELDVARVEAEALWGSDAVEAFKPLRKCVGRLRSAIEYELGDRQGLGDERLREIMAAAYGDGSDSDTFFGEVQKAITGIERLVRPRLRRFVRRQPNKRFQRKRAFGVESARKAERGPLR